MADRGWEVKAFVGSNTFVLNPAVELQRSYEASGITFYRDYMGREVTSYTYELKQIDDGGEHVRAVIYEAVGKIIGGYGVLPSWTPGRFNLDDKERLVNEEMVSP